MLLSVMAGASRDRSDDLGKVLSEKNLARLIRDESVAILYTHMGKRLQPEGPVIPEEFQEGLRRLGDSFESVEYHMDLTRTLGITFLCRSRDVTQFWGQDRSLRLKEVLSLNRMSDPINYLRWVYHQLRPGLKSFISNSLLEGINVRDGNSLHAFKRYGRCQQDRSDDLGKVLSEKNLARLIRDESVAILYTHMGKRLQPEGPVIPEEFQEGLRRLEAHFREGKVFVTTTSRLLNYLTVRRELSFVVVENENHLRVTLKSKAQVEEFGGITFYVGGPKRPRFFLGEKELELQENPRDHRQRKSYSVPLTPLSIEKIEPHFKTHAG